jgi:hypothetical protein
VAVDAGGRARDANAAAETVVHTLEAANAFIADTVAGVDAVKM